MGVEGVPGDAVERVPGVVLGPRRRVLGMPVGARRGALEDDGEMGAGGSPLGCWGWERGRALAKNWCSWGSSIVSENCRSTRGPL